MSNHDEKDLLTHELHERSAGVGGHPIGMDDVRGRARQIRHRRNAVRGAVAAMVAAVAIPSGLTLSTALDSPDSSRPDPVASGTPSPTTATPRPDGPVALTLDGIPTGAAPRVPYFTVDPENRRDDLLVTPDGVLHLDPDLGPVQAAAPFGDGWQVLAYPGPSIVHLDADGQIVSREQYRAGRSMVVANDGSRVAYTLYDTDGTQLLYSVPTSGNLEPNNWRLPGLPDVTPIGFVDEDTVAFETNDERGNSVVYTAGPGEQPRRLSGLVGASDAGEGLVVGTSKRNNPEPSVCSAAVDAATDEQLWEDCNHSLPRGALSPTGQWLQAHDSYLDGYGPLSTTILDTATGDPVVDYGQATRRGQVALLQVTWESDDTMLATLADGARFAIVRLDVNGGLELAVPPVNGEAYGDAPFYFNATNG